ncbi:contractile injection system tape measure protein [Chryseobacterium luquanense]|uniref:Contractile injection system tape measure protein n=1 Tax=Chryseobacterium luquanense TaxID=2983766 RepID=A0ABT3Y4E3_9FLAO|nr:contractile injection system tape measure protein [Chryseobacterium luquanense]MCX8533023.1 contractile injection system tape measure protein [Chryseobacterium luquanense]
MNQEYTIQKVVVEITVNNKEKAFSIKDDINSFLSIDVFPEIEKYLNALEYQLDDYSLQIPRLELNLDVKSSSLNTELKDKIAQLFKEELSEITKPIDKSDYETERDSKVYLIHHQEKTIQTFIHFLEKGYMPWWNSDTNGIAFLESSVFNTLTLNNNFQKRIKSILPKENVRERIINQLSNEQIAQLCLSLLKNSELKINLETDIIQHISKLNHPERQIVWRLVLNVVSQHLNSSNTDLKEYFSQQIIKVKSFSNDLSKVKASYQKLRIVAKIFPLIKEEKIPEIIKNTVIDNPENAKTSTETIDKKDENSNILSHKDENSNQDDGQYIQNAGLILIHPFIKTLFEYCDLLHPKTHQLIDPESCAHLLHYIATGKTNAPEYDMTFEKFLCNIPINQTINRHIKLSRKHKTQAKNVIESVQHNWNPMKKSSVALLQNEFFQRSGKLVASDHDYTLTVERKTQDILLDKLGWGISMIKLPWQEKFILVNW